MRLFGCSFYRKKRLIHRKIPYIFYTSHFKVMRLNSEDYSSQKVDNSSFIILMTKEISWTSQSFFNTDRHVKTTFFLNQVVF